MPIAAAVYRMLYEDAAPPEAVQTLMDQESRYENIDSSILELSTRTPSITEFATLAREKR